MTTGELNYFSFLVNQYEIFPYPVSMGTDM